MPSSIDKGAVILDIGRIYTKYYKNNYIFKGYTLKGGGVTPIGTVSRAMTMVKIFDHLKMALTP